MRLRLRAARVGPEKKVRSLPRRPYQNSKDRCATPWLTNHKRKRNALREILRVERKQLRVRPIASLPLLIRPAAARILCSCASLKPAQPAREFSVERGGGLHTGGRWNKTGKIPLQTVNTDQKTGQTIRRRHVHVLFTATAVVRVHDAIHMDLYRTRV